MNQTDTEQEEENIPETAKTIDKNAKKEKKKRSKVSYAIEYAIYVALILLCIFWVPEHVLQRTVVKGESMENTLHTNESLLVEKVSYHFKQPSRYDIIVFYPYGKNGDEVPESMKDQLEIDTTASGDQEEDSELYVKHVFGIPGEKIQIIGNDIYVNDKKIDDPYAKNAMKDGDAGVASEPITLGEDEYFVLGDNREVSLDSRELGPIKEKNIAGHVVLRIWPLKKFGTP